MASARIDPVQPDTEEFWDDLLGLIEHRQVIPVVGEELLTVEENGVSKPFYRVVADRLLARYGLDPIQSPREHSELGDAVSALAATGKRVKDLYRPVHEIIDKLMSGGIPAPLLQLAGIRHFDLFASATPDWLLAKALNQVRYGGADRTAQIEYAPRLPTNRRTDIPIEPGPDYTGVFYLFGKSDVFPFFAIHDEDMLEFPYTLQAGNGPERMFSLLRTRSLLLVGCNFATWLSRFFIRLSNLERLSSDQRTKKEFLVHCEIARDENLAVFLRRFSQDSRCSTLGATDFVAELFRRWSERNLALTPSAALSGAPSSETGTAVTPPNGAIFISYSSTDVAAAKNLLDGLRELGADVAWLDKSALKPGDNWQQTIDSAIQRCSFFVPLISANTERREEGYFHVEWNAAAERLRRILGRKFIFPVVIDPAYGGSAEAYKLVPDVFRQVQFSHAPLGRMTEALRQELRQQVRNLRRTRVG